MASAMSVAWRSSALSVSGVCGCRTLTKPISPDTAFAKLFHRQRVGNKHVMTGLDGARRIAHRRRMTAVNIAVADEHDGFVEGCPQLHPGTKARVTQAGILGERFGGASRFPAPFILQRLRQIPVIEGNHRLNIVRQQLIDQIAIKLDACFVNFATAEAAGEARR
jgi:hypothetical protein